MKKLSFAAMVLAAVFTFNSCEMLLAPLMNGNDEENTENSGENGDVSADLANITKDEMKEQGYSLVYVFEDDKTIIFTRKNGGHTRVDNIYDDNTHYVYIETKGSDGYTGYGYDPYEKTWSDDDYSARQAANNSFANISDLSWYFLKRGYSETGTTTIAGCPCVVYSGTFTPAASNDLMVYHGFDQKINDAGDYAAGEFAIWNEFALFGKCEKAQWDESKDGWVPVMHTVFECKKVVIGVPDSAFGKVVETSWIK